MTWDKEKKSIKSDVRHSVNYLDPCRALQIHRLHSSTLLRHIEWNSGCRLLLGGSTLVSPFYCAYVFV